MILCLRSTPRQHSSSSKKLLSMSPTAGRLLPSLPRCWALLRAFILRMLGVRLLWSIYEGRVQRTAIPTDQRNAVAPGPMDTPFFYPQETPEAVEFHKSNGMGGRLTLTGDIAPIIRFLCTEGAWITGQTIFANGGYTTR
ncbi:hypothetical protein VTN96DRAFT_290 [Rasamsonia emersonii]